MSRYEVEHDHGGVILTDTETGEDVFFQPGDDAENFLEQIGEDEEHLENIAPDYFDY